MDEENLVNEVKQLIFKTLLCHNFKNYLEKIEQYIYEFFYLLLHIYVSLK